MAIIINSLKQKKVVLLIVLIAAMDLAVLLDIPVLRQVLGFVFLTFIPGILLVRLLRLDKLKITERFVLSIGLSLFFSLFFGLLLNSVYFALGYAAPLSTDSLIISYNAIIIILIIIDYKTNEEDLSFSILNFRIDTREKTLLLLPTIFPFLSISGMHIMNVTNDNKILLLLLVLIPVYVIIIANLNKKKPERLYPVILFLVGISVILIFSLRSNHIFGMDVHEEYYLFQLTSLNQQWQIYLNNNLDSCLSISLLPTIYQSFMRINSEYLFKILFSLMFSISPLIIYIISQKYVDKLHAFLASFFFVSLDGFNITPLWARINMAILFFALVIMIMNHSEIDYVHKKVLFIIFSMCIIVSHYSTSFIYIFLSIIIIIETRIIYSALILKQYAEILIRNHRKYGLVDRDKALKFSYHAKAYSRLVSIESVVLIFILVFFWNSQVTGVAFSRGTKFVILALESLSNFFILEARGDIVSAAFGQSERLHSLISTKLIFISSWATIILIFVGILDTSIGFIKRVSAFSEYEEPDLPNEKVGLEYFIFSLACCIMLAVSLILPFVTIGYSMQRQYTMSMVLLSPFLVLGAMTISRIAKLNSYWIVTVVLVIFFLGNNGALYELFGEQGGSITLNSNGLQYDIWYINDGDNRAAKWLAKERDPHQKIYGDFVTDRWLMSQAGIRGCVDTESLFIQNEKDNGYVYMRSYNIIYNKLINSTYHGCHIDNQLFSRYKIYNNGYSQVML